MIKTKAAVLTERGGRLDVREIGLEGPKEREVLVKVEGAGLCRSDLNGIDGHTRYNMPLVLGHEGVGRVVDTGPGVTTVKEGDRVVLSWAAWCGDCFFCRKGETQQCHTVAWPRGKGLMPDWTTRFRMDGEEVYHFNGVSSFSEYTVVPESGCVATGCDVPVDVASMIGCSVVTGVGSVLNTVHVSEGATSLVIGAGSVGMSVVQALRIRGAGRIILVEPDRTKWELASRNGATDTIEDLSPDAVREMTEYGVDFAFDTVAVEKTMQGALSSVRRGGTVVLVGTPHPLSTVSLSPIEFHLEKKIVGSLYGSSNPAIDIPRVVGLYESGALNLDGFCTRRFPLERINEAVAALNERGGKFIIDIEERISAVSAAG